VPVGAAWKPEAISAPVVSKFVGVLAQACVGGNGGIAAQHLFAWGAKENFFHFQPRTVDGEAQG
jgi:hypothetical protein